MIAGIEAGGTKVVVAIANGPEDIVHRERIATRDGRTTAADIRAVLQRHPIDAIGVASFGPVVVDAQHPEHGTIRNSPKPGWHGFRWLDELPMVARERIRIDSDVGAAALAEGRYGAAAGLADYVYVTVGTGIGFGIVANGRLVHGGLHPEFGHARVRRLPDDDFAGSCPIHGDCLEGLASGSAIRASSGDRGERLPESAFAWQRAAAALGEAAALVTLATMPRRIVMGGGVMQRPHVLPAVRQWASAALAGYPGGDALPAIEERIVPAALGADAGIVGALLLAESAGSGRW